MKRKILLSIIGILIIIYTIFLSYEKINKPKEVNDNSMFAIFLEEEKDSGRYQKSNLKTWPTEEEYTINMLKSYCENGSTLRWNKETKKISLKVTGTDKCYVYFDKAEVGSAKHPHLIQTIEDLVRLSNDVNGGKTYAGEYFLLTNDLDFNDPSDYEDANRVDFKDINGNSQDEPLIKELTTSSGFVPIGKYDVAFQGNFDGNNKKIMNLFIHDEIVEIEGHKSDGLFAKIMNNVIQNLTVSGNISTKYERNMGGIIGVATNSTIKNCHNEINVVSESGDWSSGGILGTPYEKVDIVNCSNSGNVIGGAWIGGIVGGVGTGSVLIIDNCSNSGKIQKKDAINYVGVGGIIGAAINANEVENIVINNSNNTGEIIVNTNLNKIVPIGGLIGRSDAVTIINSSYNYAKLETSESSLAIIGGLVGLSNKNLTINESHNKGEIINNSGYIIGGLLGEDNATTNSTTITNSHNEGTIIQNVNNGNTRAGGLVAQINGSAVIENCYNVGNIKSDISLYQTDSQNMYGGLVGRKENTGTVIINKSYNQGDIEVIGNSYTVIYIGGLIGDLYGDNKNGTSTYIINSFNLGNFTNASARASRKSGIIGEIYLSASAWVINSYNQGDMTGTNVGLGVLLDNSNNAVNNIYLNNVFNLGNLNCATNFQINIPLSTNPSQQAKIDYQNTYYIEGLIATNRSDITFIAKPKEVMTSQSFVDELNQNITGINLENINESLKGYTLSKWKLGNDGYPTLVNE